MMAASIPDVRVVCVALSLFIGGFILSLPIYKGHVGALLHTKLGTKILMWIPIFLAFLVILNGVPLLQALALIVLLLLSLVEWSAVVQRHGHIMPASLFFVLFGFGLHYFYSLATTYPVVFPSLLITIWFATVVSDVVAFFLGTYIGRHKLPAILNKQKSWEGVAGQLIGAYLGVWLVRTFIVISLPVRFWLPIGVGSVLGDLANSFIKRKLGIKDWGAALPGHGGFIDRLASLAGSAALTFYFLSYSGHW